MQLPTTFCFFLLLIFELSSCTIIRVISGSSLELPCSLPIAYHGSAITWTFNDEDIGQLRSGSTRFKRDGLVLSISSVSAADHGKYACFVKENDMEIGMSYNIEVVAINAYTIMIPEGQDGHLPCHLPSSGGVTAGALWFKETSAGQRTMLDLEDNSTDGEKKLERLYPDDPDQSIILRNTVLEDAGTYYCESAEGETLITLYIYVRAAPTVAPHSCTGLDKPWEPCPDENSRMDEPKLKESLTQFAFETYSYLRQSQPHSNLLFSPISIAGALTHLLLGARNNTRKAIETGIRVTHDFSCVHVQMKKLREKLSGSLQMASQIFYNSQMNVSEAFTNQSIEFYEAEPTRLLENSEDNTLMINSWVANKTNNKITHLVDDVAPSTQLILLNAVSFSGQWKTKFNPNPKKGSFTKLNGDMITVPVLFHRYYMTTVTYSEQLEAQVASFPLSNDNSLYIVLPRSSTATGLLQVEENLTDKVVIDLVEELRTTPPENVEVMLPKIKLDVQPDLSMLLRKLGLSSLFEDAKLCGLNSEETFVLDDARHRAFLALTEQGVEAGAVTSFSFSRTHRSFFALRPFIILLWSNQANVPLFIGRITDP
ncbi:plasma protease C1 inhibitor [Cheilinus undulatus]|uniref:plasma protease C1 inhibitor n=1 Tax=Cheilinus undulatus TaxID=241271 RepID=UPI001BD6B239|nr:plasma protease C1 inhibitor [Cheilinus undulatus]